MKTEVDRILTTHVGSLPRPNHLVEILRREDLGEPSKDAATWLKISDAVNTCVKEQVSSGIDIVSDGEMSKMSYHVYAKHRLNGLGNVEKGKHTEQRRVLRDIQDFPEMLEERIGGGGPEILQQTMCTGPVSYSDHTPLRRDIENLKNAILIEQPVGAFMNSVSPGCLTNYVPNRYYSGRDEYREALIEAMRPEYEAIYGAGFLLQLDCPDLAGSRHAEHQNLTEKEFLRDAEKSVEALNAATRNIPPEAMRMHICWLNYAGPHTHDIPVSRLIDLLSKARPQTLLFEGANPRHEHEWEDWATADIPDNKILVPGVIDSTSNFVEHPTLVAQRLCRYANIVGRDRVMGGVDCGFGTYAGRKAVYPSVVLAKFKSLAEGARIATERLA